MGIIQQQTPPAPSESLVAKSREAQRLLGRCLLRTQQMEKALKEILIAHNVSGSGADHVAIQAARRKRVDKFGFGDLVNCVLSELLFVDGGVGPDGEPVSQPLAPNAGGPMSKNAKLLGHLDDKMNQALEGGKLWLSSAFQFVIKEEEADAHRKDLLALVKLRNRLVHRFVDEHHLLSEDACDRALTFLQDADAELERQAARIVGLLRDFNKARQEFAAVAGTPEFVDALVNELSRLSGPPHR